MWHHEPGNAFGQADGPHGATDGELPEPAVEGVHAGNPAERQLLHGAMPEVSFHVDRSAERRQQLAQPALQVPAGAVRLAHARRIDVQQRSDPRDPRGHVVAAGPVLGEPVVAEIDEAAAGQGVRTHVATRGERRFMTASVASLAPYQPLARRPRTWRSEARHVGNEWSSRGRPVWSREY